MKDWQKVKTILKSNAVQKPDTLNPSTSRALNKIITALITNKNNPMVMIVAGNVKNTNTGRSTALSKPITAATNNAVVYPLTAIPGNTFANKTTSIVVINNLIINDPIPFIFNYPKTKVLIIISCYY